MANYNNDKNFQRSVIIDNYENPNKKVNEDFQNKEYKSFNFSSESCVDNITVFLKINNDIIEDVVFNGIGCAVSTASTNIMCNILINKKRNEVLNIIKDYNKMIEGEFFDENILEELNVFSNINNQPNRIKCAKICSESIQEILSEK